MYKDSSDGFDFFCIDIAAAEAALILTGQIHRHFVPTSSVAAWNLGIVLPMIFWLLDLLTDSYQGIMQRGYLKEFWALLKLNLGAFFLILFLFYFLRITAAPRRSFLALYCVLAFPLMYIMRFGWKFYLRRRNRKTDYTRHILLITTEALAREMVGGLSASAVRNYSFFGLAVLDRPMVGEKIGNVPVAADQDSLVEFAKKNVVDEALINLPDRSEYNLALARQLLDMGITVHIDVEETYRFLPNRSVSSVFGVNVLTTTISPISTRQSMEKRLMDIVGGFVGCVITLLLSVIIGPLIYLRSPGPIYFAQTRVGKGGRTFKMYKFRSMYMDAEERKKELMAQNKIQDGLMFKIDDDPRVIRGIGTFIRRTSLDEFPQFFNVLKGEMSMVGTRPPTVDEYSRYSARHKKRLAMAPGITGLWQVSGRSKIMDFEEVVRLDTQYIENWSLDEDIKIIFKTITKIIRSDDAF